MGKGTAKLARKLDIRVTQLRAHPRMSQSPYHHSPNPSHAVIRREKEKGPPKNPKSLSQPKASL